MMHALIEKMISEFSRDGNRAFFETASFPWVADLEAGWRTIRAELDALMPNRYQIPNFQDVSPEQASLTEGDEWKTFFFYVYGCNIERNCARCPQTTRRLRCIPGMKTAMFSILAAGKHIPEHRGLYNGVLRYHLGLIIPEPQTSCRIRVRNEVRSWEEGKSLIFDDSHPHEVWNDSDSCRVVLFVDFVRPLPFPFSLVNRVQIRRISKRPLVTGAVDRLEKTI
jgi:ornithine lipid ester-linked acyl 2-hydroxylase